MRILQTDAREGWSFYTRAGKAKNGEQKRIEKNKRWRKIRDEKSKG